MDHRIDLPRLKRCDDKRGRNGVERPVADAEHLAVAVSRDLELLLVVHLCDPLETKPLGCLGHLPASKAQAREKQTGHLHHVTHDGRHVR